MSYVHVIVDMKVKSLLKIKEEGRKYMLRDRSRDEALEYILIPYVKKSSRILIEGVFISACDIKKITIFESSEDSKVLFDKEFNESVARVEMMASQGGVSFFDTTTMYDAIHNQSNDITSDILQDAIKGQ